MKKLLISLFAALFFFSCQKQSVSNRFLSLSEQQNPTQTFQVNPNKKIVLQGNLGTVIFFEPNSFVHCNGDMDEDEITIQLKEVYEYPDMILNGLTTTSNGRILESSGMIELTASIGNKNLELCNPIKILFKNVNDSPHMRTYHGQPIGSIINWELDDENELDTVFFSSYKSNIFLGEDSFTDKTPASVKINYAIVGKDTVELSREPIFDERVIDEVSILPATYALHSTKLGWINCDYFSDDDEKATIEVKISQKADTRVFLLFKNILSLIAPISKNGPSAIFEGLPVDLSAQIVSISEDNGNYEWASQDITIKKEMESIVLDYQPINFDELSEKILALEK